jgi:hypothetical protein
MGGNWLLWQVGDRVAFGEGDDCWIDGMLRASGKRVLPSRFRVFGSRWDWLLSEFREGKLGNLSAHDGPCHETVTRVAKEGYNVIQIGKQDWW